MFDFRLWAEVCCGQFWAHEGAYRPLTFHPVYKFNGFGVHRLRWRQTPRPVAIGSQTGSNVGTCRGNFCHRFASPSSGASPQWKISGFSQTSSDMRIPLWLRVAAPGASECILPVVISFLSRSQGHPPACHRQVARGLGALKKGRGAPAPSCEGRRENR
jgi:hypothetical protein